MRRFLLCAALSALFAPALFGAPKKTFTWSLDAVEVEGLGDSLAVRLKWTFLDWNIDPSKAVVFAPSVRNGGRMQTLRPVTVYGEKAAKKASSLVASGNRDEVAVVDLSRFVTVVTEDVFPRREWMDTLKVILQVNEWSKSSGLIQRSSSQRGTYVRPPAPPAPVFSWYALEPFPSSGDSRTVVLSAPVRFPGGATKFDATYMSGPEADSLAVFLNKVKLISSSRRYAVKSSVLSVSVPPSGNDREAEKLSRNRVNSMYTYLQRGGAFRVSQPSKEADGEDWETVASWVASSRFADDERIAEILSLGLGGGYAWEALSREKPAAMDEIVSDCIPRTGRVYYRAVLRARDIGVGSIVRQYYDELPEYLSPHDFWVLASDYPKDSAVWLDIILTGASLHPKNVRLNYDAAMALIDHGAVNQASEYLRHVGTLSDEGRYALAVWLYRNGRYGESLVVLDTLKEKSSFYRSVWEGAVPFMDWYDGYVHWEKLYL